MNREYPPTWSWTVALYLLLYSALLYLLVPLQLLRLWRKGHKLPAYRQRWGERFGHLPALAVKPRIWLHSVSVGETIAAAPLVERLLADYPDHGILITATTPTGSQQVQRLFGNRVEHVYYPYDLPHVIRRFLNKVRPDVLVLMETELWPNLLKQCHLRGIPVMVANARLSQKSLEGYLKLKPLLAPMLQTVGIVAAQSEADAERFRQLGARPENIVVTGNIKSDIAVDDVVKQYGQQLRQLLGRHRPVWVAASTHRGEDLPVLMAHLQVRRQIPEALLILVPRHPERFDEVAALCVTQGMSVARRSRGELPTADTDVYLGDTMGELMVMYAAADQAFVAGSFEPVGGHNPLEPASLAVPVLTGPNVRNFKVVFEQMLEQGAAKMVNNEQELACQVVQWSVEPDERLRAGGAGLALIQATRGTTDRLVTMVSKLMGSPGLPSN